MTRLIPRAPGWYCHYRARELLSTCGAGFVHRQLKLDVI
jgi:hypothetical protein